MFARIRTLDILIGLVILLLVAGSFTVAGLRGQVAEEPGEDAHGHAHDAPAPGGEPVGPYETSERGHEHS